MPFHEFFIILSIVFKCRGNGLEGYDIAIIGLVWFDNFGIFEIMSFACINYSEC